MAIDHRSVRLLRLLYPDPLRFLQSIEDVLGKAPSNDSITENIAKLLWGSHWFYRCVAEYISVTLVVFVAGGLARSRAVAGAVIGSCAISLFYAVRFGFMIYAWQYYDAGEWSIDESWYQILIDGLVMVGAPIVALTTAEYIKKMHDGEPGLAGINRWHFLWLWIPGYLYALALIAPVSRFYSAQFEGSIFVTILAGLVNLVPAFAVGLPLYYGIDILRSIHGNTMPSAARNLVGVLVLIGGLVVGVAIELGWYWMFNKLGHAISG